MRWNNGKENGIGVQIWPSPTALGKNFVRSIFIYVELATGGFQDCKLSRALRPAKRSRKISWLGK